jgi:hypothetical protein
MGYAESKGKCLYHSDSVLSSFQPLQRATPPKAHAPFLNSRALYQIKLYTFITKQYPVRLIAHVEAVQFYLTIERDSADRRVAV